MRRPRVSIGHLMAAVSVLALNAGLVRAWIVAGRDEALIAVSLTAIAVQVGIFLLIRGRRRAFWAGFVVVALLTMSTWVFGTPGSARRLPGGRIVVTPASATYRVWESYTEGATRRLERLGYPPLLALRRPNQSRLDEGLVYGTFAVLFAFPQLLLASVGGLIGLGCARVVAARSGRDGGETSTSQPLKDRIPAEAPGLAGRPAVR